MDRIQGPAPAFPGTSGNGLARMPHVGKKEDWGTARAQGLDFLSHHFVTPCSLSVANNSRSPTFPNPTWFLHSCPFLSVWGGIDSQAVWLF